MGKSDPTKELNGCDVLLDPNAKKDNGLGEPVLYKLCCGLSEKYCKWYDTTWFMFTCIGVVILLIVMCIVIIACCCCKGRGGGGKDQNDQKDQEASEDGEEA